MSGTGLWTTDGKYEMLPDNTIVSCQFIDHSGNFIKKDKTLGKELVNNVRIMDQRIFYSNILYAVEYPIGSGDVLHTRHNLIQMGNLPE